MERFKVSQTSTNKPILQEIVKVFLSVKKKIPQLETRKLQKEP